MAIEANDIEEGFKFVLSPTSMRMAEKTTTTLDDDDVGR
jgi:hypothetical protein